MAMIQITKNHRDHSSTNGFQFEFLCDKCGNGHMSRFVPNKAGMAAGVLHAAGSLFGGVFGQAASAGDHLKDLMRGGARDEAFAAAVEEARTHFRQCTRCGKWVCPDVCWNASKGLCEECAPDLAAEAAAAQAQAAVEQVQQKARQVDHVADIDMKKDLIAQCPHCNAPVQGGKFCAECGKPISGKISCGRCGTEFSGKFCPECGTKAP